MNERILVQDNNTVTNERLIELLRAVPVRDLIREAIGARENSYSPYSEYQVGAAIYTSDGIIYTGCNIENASYGATVCAERTAIFKAISEGAKGFRAIAIVGSPKGRIINQFAYPCGICRQVMNEFADAREFIVIVAKSETEYRVFSLDELLPQGFGPLNLAE